MSLRIKGLAIVLSLVFFSQNAFAASVSSLQKEVGELKALVQDLTKVVKDQNSKIAYLESRLGQTAATGSTYSSPSSAQNALSRVAPKWTPEIGVVADMVAKFDSPKEDEEGADRLSVREVELIFGSAIDPYSRLDATLSFSDFEEASLEEAYVTHFALPWDITGRFGKFKPKIGKVLPIHRDSLDTVDLPRVLLKWFGHEGYNKAGADFTKALDFPWPLPQEVSFGVLEGGNGEEGSLFSDVRRRPTIYTHLENYMDLSDDTGLEIGFSHLAGSKDADPSLEVQVFGVDATLTHHLSATSRIKVQSEVLFQHRQETDLTEVMDDDLWGAYALVDYRINPQFSAGFRYDMVELVDAPLTNVEEEDTSYTGYLTFYQSEFARWRLQYTHVDSADGIDDNQVLLQGTFSIGEHKHKIN